MSMRVLIALLVALISNQVLSQEADVQKKSSKQVSKKTYAVNSDATKPSKITMDFFKSLYVGNLEMSELLLQQGADINCANCNNAGQTPLMAMAAEMVVSNESNPKVLWLIKRGANLNAQDKLGETALMKSLHKGVDFTGVPDALIMMNQGAKTGINDKNGRNALHHFAHRGVPPVGANGHDLERTEQLNTTYENMVKNLISSGVNVNETDMDGNTVLMYASEQCNAGVINLYLSQGANQNLKNSKGETAMSIALNKAISSNDKYCNEVVASLKKS